MHLLLHTAPSPPPSLRAVMRPLCLLAAPPPPPPQPAARMATARPARGAVPAQPACDGAATTPRARSETTSSQRFERNSNRGDICSGSSAPTSASGGEHRDFSFNAYWQRGATKRPRADRGDICPGSSVPTSDSGGEQGRLSFGTYR